MNVMESSQDLQVKRDVKDVCMPMRLVYEALVKAGRLKDGQGKKEELTFKDEDISNVNGNPLPNHGGSKVNAVEDGQDL